MELGWTSSLIKILGEIFNIEELYLNQIFFVFWREKTSKISKFWCGERFMQRFENRNSFRSGINLKKVFDVKIMIFHAILKEFTWMQILSFLSFEKVLWKSLSKIHVNVSKHKIIAYQAFKWNLAKILRVRSATCLI